MSDLPAPVKPEKKFRKGNWFLFAGLVIFMTAFTVVSVMGNIASESIDKPAGAVFLVGAALIILGLIF
jgi:hypothetical protein